MSDDVCDPQGEHVGYVEELMIDVTSGRVAYAVVSLGGLLGVGERLLAIPWAALRFDTERCELALQVSREALAEAEAECFDKHDWPDLADIELGTRLHLRYLVKPYWEA